MPTDDMSFYDSGYEEEENSGLDLGDTSSDDVKEEVKPVTLDLSDVDLGDVGDFTLDEEDSSDSNDIISSEEKLRVFSDTLLSCCIGEKEIKKYALEKLMTLSNPRIFRDENYVLFSVLYFYRNKLRYLNIDEEFLKLFLNRNRELLIKSRAYIDINSYGEVDGSVELGYIAGVIKHFNRLKTFPDISTSEFETVFEKYLIEFKAIEASKVYRQANVILTEGLKIGGKLLCGFEDSQNFCKKKLAEIEGLVDNSMGTGFVTMSEIILQEKPDNKKPVRIGDFGGLKALTDVFGGIYTGLFYSIIAPPKAGKTKLCARICHNLAVKEGINVTVWAHEGGNEAWTAQMRAIHFDYIYNTGVDLLEKKYGVTQEVILHDSFKSDDLRQLEMSSSLDLATNQSYGVVDYIDRPFVVETFLEDINTSVKGNNSKIVIIDYLQLIGSVKNSSERERVSDAYKTLLNYCRKNNVAILSPAQFKQDSFDELIKKNTVDSSDLRTAAGTSSEVIRTPDVLFALWATIDDIRNNSMKIISLPCRMNKAFPNINVRMDLGTCQFISVD